MSNRLLFASCRYSLVQDGTFVGTMPLSTRIDTASSASSPTHALLSREEAARYLGISTATLRRMVKARTISSVKIGHRRLFELEALRAFVASKRQDAVA